MEFINKNFIKLYIVLLIIYSVLLSEFANYVKLENKYTTLKRTIFHKGNIIDWGEVGKYGIIAWIKFGNIDMPVCYTNDNSVYKRNFFDMSYSLYGGAYLNENSDSGFTRNVNLIYLFSSRYEMLYSKLKFQALINKKIFLYLPDNSVHEYKILSIFRRSENEYREYFKTENDYKKYQEELRNKSVIDYKIKTNSKKRLLLLSTFPPLAHTNKKVLTLAAVEC